MSKTIMNKTYVYFKPKEFECKCGCGVGFEEMDKDILDKLDTARAIAGIPFKLNSAMRCSTHNKKIGGSITSSHLKGFAVDIAANTSTERYKILGALFEVGFNRIGIAKNFIHVDIDPSKDSELIWLY